MQSCKINILFLPYHNTGGHFINWSLYYICNQITYLANNSKIVHMDAKESTSTAWHQYPSFIVKGFDSLKNTIHTLRNVQDIPVVNLYLANLEMNNATNILFNRTIEESTVQQRTQAHKYIATDSKKMLSYCQEQQIPLVVFDYYHSDLLNIFYNNRFPLDWNGYDVSDSHTLYSNFEKTFFKITGTQFDSNIWDQREKLALILKTQTNYNISTWYNQHLPHLYYTTDDIWNDLPLVIVEICQFLKLPVDINKLESWQLIWDKWRKNHQPQFSRHFDRIIDSIVNNRYMILDRFNLNIFHEALIQNALIVRHNLNLKTWQLAKFPSNTQDLHKLLEPNIHH
jgi:hypothetical protein